MKTRLFTVVSMLAMLLGLLPSAAYAEPLPAQVIVPVMGTTPTVVQLAVNDSSGNQTDPHVSGDWVSYTDNSVYGVRFQNLDLGTASDRLITQPQGFYDSLSDISGNNIAFMRATTNYQSISLVQIDPFGNPGPATEVSPVTLSLRNRAVIGGDTIAYEDRAYGGSSSSPQEISLSNTADAGAPAFRLTNDTLVDQVPAVSPDGNVVVWVKCEGSWQYCDIWRAERVAGVWGAPEQVTGIEGTQSLPDTNGPVTVYGSTAGGDDNIRWSVKDASGAYVESYLSLPGIQRNPNISGDLITFESSPAVGAPYDIYLYDLATNRLYQLTNSSISESLTDVSVGYGGLVRVAWAQPKQVYPFDMDIYAMSFLLDTTAPVITAEIQGTLGQNGWYTGDVALNWTISDDQSDFTSTGCDPVSITSDQAATDYTCEATSDGGTASQTVSIARDATKPVTTVTGVAEGASYELGSVPQAGCSSTDNLSGVAMEATVALTGGDAQGAGSVTATCSGALDAAGNAADPAAIHFTVTNPASDIYTFTGFFQPVDNPGDGPSWVYNSVKAGAAVPVKFGLSGDQGLDVFAPNYPTSRPASCAIADVMNPIEETVAAGSSSLSYDAASDTYTYIWKTNKLWVNTCRALNVTLADGSQHLAYFKFK